MSEFSPLPDDGTDSPGDEGLHAGRSITPADERALSAAQDRLRTALDAAPYQARGKDVAEARINLRTLAAKMRDAGYWRADKQGLRSTVALLWQADRFVNDQALRGSEDGRPSA